MTSKNKKAYVKLERNGRIQLPIDFDDPGITKEVRKFLKEHTPILSFRFPKNQKKTMVISFIRKDGKGRRSRVEYDPAYVPSYIR